MAQRALLYYDSGCGICALAARWVSRLDIFGRIELRASLDEMARAAGISQADLDCAIYLILPSGETLSGFYAFRKLLGSLPPTWPFLPLAWFPGAAYVGVRWYRWLADHRHSLFKCGE